MCCKSACKPRLLRIFLSAFERSLDDIYLLGLDLAGSRVAALFKLYALPFCQQIDAFVAIIDVNEDILAIVSRDEAVPLVLPEKFVRAVLHLNVLDPSD